MVVRKMILQAFFFEDIKSRLMRFVKTPVEKQARIFATWEELGRGNYSALRFEPYWEKVLAELEQSGLARTSQELFSAYLRRLGSRWLERSVKIRGGTRTAQEV